MAEDSKELDLYASPGWRESFGLRALGWKGVLTLGTSLTIVVGAAGHGWMTTTAPVTVDQALEEFRQSSSHRPAAGTEERKQVAAKTRGQKEKSARKQRTPKQIGEGQQTAAKSAPVAAPPSGQAAQRQTAPRSQSAASTERGSQYERSAPREGVYSWATEGWESAGGARRNFPEESQRIVTIEQGGWFQHHYFSDQREIWTRFRSSQEGAAIAMQRNKVTFGPVTEDSSIDFAPPMLVGPAELEVGQKWEGRWSGKTSGTYRGETFERVKLDIGGEQVEAFGIVVYMEMRGEIEGEVEARVWLSPKHAITVREYYKQRVKADVGDYRAEWTMTLKSLQPQT